MESLNLSSDLPNGHLYNLTADELNEALWSDQHYIKVLKTLASGAQGLDLKTECEDHAIQIELQMGRLKTVFKMTGIKINAKENKAMAGLLGEAVESIEKFRGEKALDTVLISAAQKAGRFRMAIYQSALTYLGLMEFEDAELLLGKTYHEEDMANDKLLTIAYSKLLPLTDLPQRKKGLLSTLQEFFSS